MTATPRPAPPRPSPGPGRAYRFPAFERHQLPNGLRVVVAPVHKLPVATVVTLVDAGASSDPQGQEGLAQLCAKLLAEGTQDLGGAALTERLERLGTSMESDAEWDGAVVSLTAMPSRLPAALALVGTVLMDPAFPAREVDRLKKERLAELLQQKAEPRGLADEMFVRFAYTTESRYRLPDGGTEESVDRLEREAIAQFYRARYQPSAVTVVLVGDVTTDAALRMVEGVYGGWRGTPVVRAVVDDRPRVQTRSAYLVEKLDAPQSELRIGHVGVSRRHPDYFALVVMNAILGGLFSSRINLNLREVHAYTYGAHSGFDWRRGAGPFTVSTAVKSDVSAEAAREIVREIERMRESEVTESELSLATSYLSGVFPIRYETTSATASALANLELYDLPADFFDQYREQMQAVSGADVLRVAREHLHADALQLLAVGDPAAVSAALQTLDFGPVAIYDADGRPIG